MLVVVFNNGVVHKIKGCNKYGMPSSAYYGDIIQNSQKKGTIYDNSNIALCYFADDKAPKYQFAIEQLEILKKFVHTAPYLDEETIMDRIDEQIKELKEMMKSE